MIAQRRSLTGTALAGVVALMLVAAGCGGGGNGGGGGGSVASGIAARVAGEEITRTELDEVIGQAQERLKAQGQKVPAAGSQEYQAFQQNALQFLVQRVQFDQKAKELGVTVSEKEVDERLERVIKQFFGGSEKKYEQSLEKQGISGQQVRDELRSTLISEKIFEKVGSAVKVTDADIRAYYDSHPELYAQKSSRDVRHILVPSKELADDLYRQLQNGADFAALAKKYSTDPGSKAVGGKLTVARGETVPAFEKVAFALEVGEVAKPVKTQYGWHVIEALTAEQEGKKTPIASVRKTISDTLLGQKKSDAVTKWLEDLKKEYEDKITYAPGLAPPATETQTTTTTSTG
jgi:parvulin-like peptidyl-prolyl isomerase